MINALLSNLSTAGYQFVIIHFSVSHRSRTIFHYITDCEFRAGLTLPLGEAGLPLWTQSAYLAKQGLYSKSGVSTHGISVSLTSVENVIMSKFHSVSNKLRFYGSVHEPLSLQIPGLRLSRIF